MGDQKAGSSRTQRKSKADVRTCSSHPYNGPLMDHLCTGCEVRCVDPQHGGCGKWKKASDFKRVRKPEKLTVGLWSNRCKECEGTGEGIF